MRVLRRCEVKQITASCRSELEPVRRLRSYASELA